jgi:prepilin-type N-terminal cleavage/methylation domain-containing protein
MIRRPTLRSGSRSPRAAYTLIETLVAISVAGIMFAAVITAIHLLLGSERRISRGIVTQSSLARLSRTFRQDVHAADRAVLGTGELPGLTLSLPSGAEVRYRPSERGVLREVVRSEVVESQESYRLAETLHIQFDYEAGESRVRAVIAQSKPDEVSAGPGNRSAGGKWISAREMTFEATLARDRRFLRDAGAAGSQTAEGSP